MKAVTCDYATDSKPINAQPITVLLLRCQLRQRGAGATSVARRGIHPSGGVYRWLDGLEAGGVSRGENTVNRLFRHPWVQATLRLALGLVFLDAGLVKVRHPQAFADSLEGFRLFSPSIAAMIVNGLPWLEIFCAALLLGGWWRRRAAFSLLMLNLLFLAVLAIAALRGLPVDCGCFGSAAPTMSGTWIALARDLLLLAMTGMVYWHEKPESFASNSPSS
ncbi:MAG: MauE/DoxX family redox-associated membrane protein [Chthoniobacteraceae bacterium]